MDLFLDERVYVVTGATRGLGRASVEALLADGARVVLSGRHQAGVDQAVAELGSPDVVGVAVDNSDPSAPARLIAAAHERWGRLDGALISVGGPPLGTVASVTDDQWEQAFGSVFLGTVRLAREIAAVLTDGGSIAFVLSMSVRQPIAHLAVSNGLRPGLAMVAKTLADELGPRGIRVNGLLPGRIGTERIVEIDAASGDAEASQAAARAQIPLGRYGDPVEFGRVAAFVLSPAASFVSGVMVPVDGGMGRSL
ncbi:MULTISPECIES: SDR family oxidoreductase [unclassified Nocardioides]|uniref:SDR family oxidoreductase n=1 Tax=unclassified Nocardioides TaxID=2615069 RepID=UPI0009E94CA1|nr:MULTISPECIES: SDR family oxidoreductase [unclassified Nocardioides]